MPELASVRVKFRVTLAELVLVLIAVGLKLNEVTFG